jgi:hypothetical protein
VATVETAEELVDLLDATGAGRTLVACLVASPDTVARRIDAREPDTWKGREGLIAHARRLADTVPSLPGIDICISTDHLDAATAAGHLLDALAERGML